MNNIQIITNEVDKLLNTDNSGHGMDHVNRVSRLALLIAEDDDNKELISAIALLHDADDYKLFGIESSNKLTNTTNILLKTSFTNAEKELIKSSIKTIGYSKRISGIVPTKREAMIVSDADMLDAMGAIGILRSYQYNLSHGNPFFNKTMFPIFNISADEYIAQTRGTVVNRIFEKLLKLKDLMLTDKGKDEALRRYNFIVSFLKEYFYEENVPEWQDYLDKYTRHSR